VILQMDLLASDGLVLFFFLERTRCEMRSVSAPHPDLPAPNEINFSVVQVLFCEILDPSFWHMIP
jgi:hypothetical protein